MVDENKTPTPFEKALGKASSLAAGTEDQNATIVDLGKPVRDAFENALGKARSLVRGTEDQKTTFVDLGGPILPAIGLIETAARLVADAAAFVAYASERQLLDRKVLLDALRTLRDIPKSDTMFWAGEGAKAEKKWDVRQKEAETDKKFIKASLGQPNFLPMKDLVDNGIAFLKSHFNNFNYTATEGDGGV